MKKILYITNFSSYEEKCATITNFSRAAFEAALSAGLEFHINTNNIERIRSNDDKKVKMHLVQIYRQPFSKDTWIAYKQLMKVLSENNFEAIHCNTPIGGVLGRICGKKKNVKKIIYQAHGFHFYKGAPLLNWLIYYPIERWLAHYTDVLITINKEDYEIAKKFKLKKNGKVIYVPGVGIDLKKFSENNVDCIAIRKKLGLKEDDFVCIGIGRVEENKNYKPCIEAISKLNNNKIHLLICGEGAQQEELKQLVIHLNLENQIHFLGYRRDIHELLKISDCYISLSKREGLPRALMEAMASGLSCIVSNIRGNVDLIKENEGGFLVPTNKPDYIAYKINTLFSNSLIREEMSKINLTKIKEFDINKIIKKIEEIYVKFL